MTVFEAIGLALAAFAAGGLNAVAGGGSLISFPALLAAGYPAVSANVTSTVALWPGSVGGSIAYRAELQGQRDRIRRLGITCILGALLGSALLLIGSSDTFEKIVPWLILFAVGLLAVQPRLAKWVRSRRVDDSAQEISPAMLICQFGAAVYGAYFGAGLGVITLAVLGIFLHDNLQRLNGLKGILQLTVNGVAMLIFAIFGPVVWSAALLMAASSWLGGFLGVRVARKLDPRLLRAVVMVAGLAAAIHLFFN